MSKLELWEIKGIYFVDQINAAGIDIKKTVILATTQDENGPTKAEKLRFLFVDDPYWRDGVGNFEDKGLNELSKLYDDMNPIIVKK